MKAFVGKIMACTRKPHPNYQRIHDTAVTALVFGVLWVLYYLPSSIAVLDPLSTAFRDFELTDIVFSQLRDDTADCVDTSIVLVNISTLPRPMIAEQIKRIAAHKPAVIGVDAFFRSHKDHGGDSALVAALHCIPSIVLVSKLASYNPITETFVQREMSLPMFQTYMGTGFANVISNTSDSNIIAATDMIRSFSPREMVRDSVEWAFAVKLAWYLDSNAVNALFKRNNSTENINYVGNYSAFFALDAPDVLSSDSTHSAARDLSFVRGKIVILGFVGETLGHRSADDMFFTPLNPRYAGRAIPDMFGTVIHANIASMILRRDYIATLPEWLEYTVAVLLCYLNVVLMTRLYYQHKHWYDVARLAVQFVQSVALLVAFVLAFHWLRVKLDATLLVAAVVVAAPAHELYHALLKIVASLLERRMNEPPKDELREPHGEPHEPTKPPNEAAK